MRTRCLTLVFLPFWSKNCISSVFLAFDKGPVASTSISLVMFAP